MLTMILPLNHTHGSQHEPSVIRNAELVKGSEVLEDTRVARELLTVATESEEAIRAVEKSNKATKNGEAL